MELKRGAVDFLFVISLTHLYAVQDQVPYSLGEVPDNYKYISGDQK